MYEDENNWTLSYVGSFEDSGTDPVCSWQSSVLQVITMAHLVLLFLAKSSYVK